MIDVDQLYRDHAGLISGMIANRLPDTDPSVIDDLTADVFERVVRFADRFEDRGVPPKYWLCQIANRVVLDWHRARRGVVHADMALLDYTRGRVDAGTDAQVDQIDLTAALEALPFAEREITRLASQGYLISEAGVLVDVSPHQAWRRRRRALGRLRDTLAGGAA